MPLSPPKPARKHLIRNALLIASIFLAIVVVLASIFYLVPRPFDLFIVGGSCGPHNVTLPLPSGSSVSFNWNVSDGHTLSFVVQAPNGSTAYSATAAGGSGAFRAASGGSYVFTAASCTRNVIGVFGSFSLV